MKGWVLIILLVLPLVLAEEYSVNTADNLPLENMHATVEFDNGEKTLVFVQEGVMRLQPPSTAKSMKIKFDSLSTLGTDYYVSTLVTADPVLTVLPVGSVFGFVYGANGKALPRARVEAACGAQYGNLDPLVTDDFGAFVFDALPVGVCTLRASRDDNIGSLTVNVTHGGLVEEASVILDRSRVVQNLWWVFGLFLTLIIVGLAWVFTRGITLERKKSKKLTRLDTVLPTLNKKEEAVVVFLLEHGENYQNKLVHELHIPKTTLVRLFKGLEDKQIINVEKVGKTKKIRLTEWITSVETGKD